MRITLKKKALLKLLMQQLFWNDEQTLLNQKSKITFIFQSKIGAALVCLFCTINLVACSSKTAFMDYRPPHETLEIVFINTISSSSWQPIQADANDVNLFYLPDGVTMARLNFEGTINSPELEKYLNGILARLLEHSPISGVKAKVQLIGDDKYGQIQATPDGTILLPLRFLQASETEDEIAWLLAHELSHIILTHHDSDWAGRYHQQLNASLGEALLITKKYTKIASEFGADENTKELKTAMTVYTSSMLLHDIASGNLFPAWKRAEEDEADLLAIDLCALSGFSIDEADLVLNKLGQWAKDEDKNRQKLMDLYKQEFTDEVETFNNSDKMFNIKSVGDWESYGIKLKKNFLEHTVQDAKYDATKSHRIILERQDNLLAYTDKFYAQIDKDPNMKKWQEQQSKAKNARLFEAYTLVWEAQKTLSVAGPDNAEPLIRKAFKIDRGLKYQSYPRWIFYKVRKQQNKKRYAIQHLKLALKAAYPTVTIYKAYIFEKIEQENNRESKKVLKRAWVDLKKPPVFLPLQIKVNKLANDNKTAKRYYTQCHKMAISEEIKKQCDQEYNK